MTIVFNCVVQLPSFDLENKNKQPILNRNWNTHAGGLELFAANKNQRNQAGTFGCYTEKAEPPINA